MTQLNVGELKREIADLARAAMDRLGYLRDRWQDEREYEDFKDYVFAMARKIVWKRVVGRNQ
jgi:hypothetical protein